MAWQQILETTPASGAAAGGLGEWYAALLACHPAAGPLELAILGGYQAATPGLAFLAGYQAALRALWPAAPGRLGAFCVTEQRRLRPEDMQTRVSAGKLNGSKDFVTAGDSADWLLVSARVEPEGATPRLAVFKIDSSSEGVLIVPGTPLPMLPDVPHARLQLRNAQGEGLPGDGWEQYVKPFRTLEDLHVLAAVCAWTYGVGVRQQWPLALRLRLLAVLTGCAGVADEQLHSAAGHLALAALSAGFAGLRGELDAAFAAGPPALAEQWRRDQRVLDLAQPAREKRLQKALLTLGLSA